MKIITIRNILIGLVIAMGFMSLPVVAFRLVNPAVDMVAAKRVIGEEFLPLTQYLAGCTAVGFATDIVPVDQHRDTNIPIMLAFQQAQFALSPVYLDHIHPKDYCSVVVSFHSKKGLQEVMLRIGGRVVWGSSKGVALIRRYDVSCLDRL